MVALEAGCQQQPSNGTHIGLNDTIFSPTLISAVDPFISKNSSSGGLSNAAIAGIVIAIVVVFIVLAGIFFIQHWKRQNRRLEFNGSQNDTAPKRRWRRTASSSLSSRCRSHLTPRSPTGLFFKKTSVPTTTIDEEEPPPHFGDQRHTALRSNPVSTTEVPAWVLKAGASDLRTGPGNRNPTIPPGSNPLPNNVGIAAATAIPTVPDAVYYSGSSLPQARIFPAGRQSDNVTAPHSAVSTGSTAELLPITAPAAGWGYEYQQTPAEQDFGGFVGNVWDQEGHATAPRKASAGRPGISLSTLLGGGGGRVKKAGSGGSSTDGSPVETRQISVRFPGPPSPKRF